MSWGYGDDGLPGSFLARWRDEPYKEKKMSKPREFYVPEEFVFNSVDEALDKYPDQAVSVLYDLADMKSAADKLADMLERMNNLFHRYNGREFQPALDLIKEYRGEK